MRCILQVMGIVFCWVCFVYVLGCVVCVCECVCLCVLFMHRSLFVVLFWMNVPFVSICDLCDCGIVCNVCFM